MKLTKRHIGVAGLGAICAVTAALGISLHGNEITTLAQTTDIPSSVYYYDALTDDKGNEYTLAKKFYDALDKMNKDGDFKDGIVEYSLDGIVTSEQIKAWAKDGVVTVPKAFSAARDAYYMDHPELFYIDIYKLTLSAGYSGGKYQAYIDTGREANVYADDGFTLQSEVETAIAAYSAKVNEIAEYAETEAAKDTYGTAKEVLIAKYTNKYLAEHTDYDYGTLDEVLAGTSTVTTASCTSTAYGALVLNKSVCNGYARAFKAVMDKLEIPCVVVNGYSVGKNSKGEDVTTGEYHAWNYVWFKTPEIKDENEEGVAALADEADEGAWYAYDVTWNSTGKSSTGKSVLQYTNMGSLSANTTRYTDGEISSSGYKLKYPELSEYDYGTRTNSGGITYSISYENEGNSVDNNGNPRVFAYEYVGYNGKGAVRLFEEDGLRLIRRAAYYKDDKTNSSLVWQNWDDIYVECKEGLGFISDGWLFSDNDVETRVYSEGALYTQYAVIGGLAPDCKFAEGNEWPTEYTSYYSPESDTGEYMVALSEIFINKSYGAYAPAPYVLKSTPSHQEENYISDSMGDPKTGLMKESNALTISVTYDEPLHKLDETKPIGVSFTTKCDQTKITKYARFVHIANGEDVQLSEDKYTLTFKFLPSLLYEHNGLVYSFQFTNVGSAKEQIKADHTTYTSDKAPNPVSYRFTRSFVACPNVLGGGRLYIDCCAQPTLVSNSDLSAMNFTDEDGNSTFSEGLSSQMMLVAEKVSADTETAMLNGIDSGDFGLNKNDIKTSETYDIGLQLCGRFAKISDNSYVKIALGFPEGYGPDDEGVTFKIFHRKHVSGDQYIIEEIPCVVTQYGIVATVKSFSPYMVAVVDADKASNDKTIYASIDGSGGKLTLEDGQIQSVKEGGSYTYTIKPDEGYGIYSVKLNGVEVKDNITDGKLTLTYAELSANNELEIKYIAESAARRFEEKEIIEPVKIIIPVDNSNTVGDKGGSNAVLWIVLGVSAVVIAGCAVGLVLVLKRRKKDEE